MKHPFSWLLILLLLIVIGISWQKMPSLFASSIRLHSLINTYIPDATQSTRFSDFESTSRTITELEILHNAWQKEFQLHIHSPPRIPMIRGKAGIFPQSGYFYDTYQNQLHTSYETLSEIHQELESALDLACEICQQKQRIELQTCPLECNR